MLILFTGHRDRSCSISSLQAIKEMYPNATWLHGGAQGFDTQVEIFAQEAGITTTIIRPDYKKYGRAAPLVRNDKMLQICDMVVALYDGRKVGGTYYTMNKARKMSKLMLVLAPE